MIIRLADAADLPPLKAMYSDVVTAMEAEGLFIWDSVYPCEFLHEDIVQRRLYILMEDGKVCAAFALCDADMGESAVRWQDQKARAIYMDRLAVNVGCRGSGLGCLLLGEAEALAKRAGAEYLRLFVVDTNHPALRLYERAGFIRADGTYTLDTGESQLTEYGYEKRLG